MGYRMYLARAPKGAKLIETVDEGDGYPYQKRTDAIVELYELGKYVEWRKEGAVNLMGEDAYTELFIVDKEFLLEIIDEYRKLNNSYYKDLHNNSYKLIESIIENESIPDGADLTVLAEIASSIRQKNFEWGGDGYRYCNLKLEPSTDGQITKSWLYEYGVFNLVHILHTFDWENDDLIYYGC